MLAEALLYELKWENVVLGLSNRVEIHIGFPSHVILIRVRRFQFSYHQHKQASTSYVSFWSN